jgi:hypothetical protein
MAQANVHPDRRLISSEDVVGTDVHGLGDEVVGEIDHLLIEKVSGRVAYAVMSFGGFLGLAHSPYPIPWSALKYDTGGGGFRTGITEEQLRDAPEYSTIPGSTETGKPVLISIMATALTGALKNKRSRGHPMPIILWLLGVPLGLILVLWLFGAF